jgi:hypothetical protein
MQILSGISLSDATNCELPQLCPCSLQQYAEVAFLLLSSQNVSPHSKDENTLQQNICSSFLQSALVIGGCPLKI